jgi:hypothetical protein
LIPGIINRCPPPGRIREAGQKSLMSFFVYAAGSIASVIRLVI